MNTDDKNIRYIYQCFPDKLSGTAFIDVENGMPAEDTIFYPEKSLNKHDYMYYQVAKVQAKYKTYRPVKDDTLIFEARRYFAKHNKDLEKTTLAHFYSGAVYREQNDNKKE